MKSKGDSQIVQESQDKWAVVQDDGTILFRTRFYGIAKNYSELFNVRGSEFDLDTGEWLEGDSNVIRIANRNTN